MSSRLSLADSLVHTGLRTSAAFSFRSFLGFELTREKQVYTLKHGTPKPSFVKKANRVKAAET